MRILMDPTAVEGGAVEKVVEKVVEVEKIVDKKIEIPASELVELQSLVREQQKFIDQIKAEADAKAKEVEKAALIKLAEEQGAKTALEKQAELLKAEVEKVKAEAAEREAKLLSKEVESLILGVTAGLKPVSQFAAQQADSGLKAKFKAERNEAGEVVIKDRATGRVVDRAHVAEVVKTEFGHNFVSSETGGAGVKGTTLTKDAEKAKDPQQAAIERAKAIIGSNPRGWHYTTPKN